MLPLLLSAAMPRDLLQVYRNFSIMGRRNPERKIRQILSPIRKLHFSRMNGK